MTLKLYVWDGILTDWSAGMAFALANSVAEAREVISPAEGHYLGWAAAEALYTSPGHLDEPGMLHGDLRAEPLVFDPASSEPVSFVIWGGG